MISYFLTKLGDAIASPKTTLAWLTSKLGTPAFVLGFLVPIRESGSMIPQLFIGSVIRQLEVRKWVWVVGSLDQFLAIAGIGLVALNLEGAAPWWGILVLVTVFSLARGFCSVAAKMSWEKPFPNPSGASSLAGQPVRRQSRKWSGLVNDSRCRSRKPPG